LLGTAGTIFFATAGSVLSSFFVIEMLVSDLVEGIEAMNVL